LSDQIQLPTCLRRAGELELERNRRSGRRFSLILLRVRSDVRWPRTRRNAYARLRSVADQHLRPFDAVDVAPSSGLLGIVAYDADASSATHIGDRLSTALVEAGGLVVGVGAATYPEDGLLLTHLVDRAARRLDGSGPDDRGAARIDDGTVAAGDRR
jgi:hypothetical protein